MHEQNARPGIANRLGARLTRHVAVTFEGTPLPHAVRVGMPLRREIARLDRAALRAGAREHLGVDADAPTLLVTGGSLGAQRLNEAVVEVVPDLLAAGVNVLHLTGAGKAVAVPPGAGRARYAAVEFTDRMDLAYAAADLVLCRAGASTVCEVTAVGLPAVYVPLAVGNGEQRLNAGPVVRAGGGLLVDDADLTPAWLREHLVPLATDASRLRRMGEVARASAVDRRRRAARRPRAPGRDPGRDGGGPVSTGLDLTREVPPAEELSPLHLVGIGGIGMSGIARILLARGLQVSGSDAKDLPVLAALRAVGGRAEVGFDAARLEGVRTVVASSAIRADNVELVRAAELGLTVLHRSQALQSLLLGHRAVAVAGTNGKTTTSSMLTVLLQHAGLDPSFAIGGELVGAGTNGHAGSGEVFVAEADESDSSFLVYTPAVSVVTNVQPDHLDHHGTAENVVLAFEAFADRLGPDGTLVACADDPGSAALAARHRGLGRPVLTYGTADDADVRVEELRLVEGTSTCVLADRAGDQTVRTPLLLQVPGAHNVSNAAGAYAAARVLGVDPRAAVDGLAAFTGSRRRFEARGEAGGVRVYDDYAHNPAKVAAAVATGRQVAGTGRLVVVFQPHLYSRTLDFAAEFARALSDADEVVVMDVYAAREDPVPGVTGALVADQVDLPADRVTYVPSWSAVPAAAVSRSARGDLVLTVGAGDVTMIGREVLALLAAREPGDDA